MKKSLLVMSMLCISLLLTGCFKKNNDVVKKVVTPTTEKVADLEEKIVDEVIEAGTGAADTEDVGEDSNAVDTDTKALFNEYSIKVDIVSTDPSGAEFVVETNVYKKGDKQAYEILEMKGPQPLPFKPIKNMIVGEAFYSHIEVEGEELWFKATNVEQQAQAMFDLASVHESFENKEFIEETKTETINGKEMTCHYLLANGGKACLHNGIFTYGEDKDIASGMKTTISVTNYTQTVDDVIFTLPDASLIKDMSELMKVVSEKQAAGALPTGEEVVAE